MTTSSETLSAAAQSRLQQLGFVGSLREADLPSGQRLLSSSHGRSGEAEHINLSFAVDERDEIRQVRFNSPATGVLLLAYETLAELCQGITVKQASHITPMQVKRKLMDRYELNDISLPWPDADPFPILQKICNHQAPSVHIPSEDTAERFEDLSLFEKVKRIESVLDDHVRPMLASDGGGLELVDLRDDELLVHYQGACGSCSSSIGGTLVFIQETLNDALGSDLTITPQGLDEAAFIM